jgi:hypothetical protein
MAKTNGKKPELVNAIAAFTTPVDGSSVAAMFATAGNAIGVGHRTYTNVPMPVIGTEGEPKTRAEMLYISAQLARLALGSEDYETIDHAASVTARTIPTQYTLLEDAADVVAQAYCARAGIVTAKRSDRDGLVAQLLAAKPTIKVKGTDQLVSDAIRDALVALISATKAVKGKATATTTALADISITDEE